MTITEISKQKRKGRYNLFVDGQFYSGIDDFGLISLNIKVGDQISQDELKEKVFESEVRSAFDYLIDYFSKYLKSRKEIEKKLKEKGYSQDVVEAAIKKTEEYGYVNDNNFARIVLENKKNKSKKEMVNFLFSKGINKEIISSQINNISETDETSSAIHIAEKYMKNKQNTKENLSKLYAFLYRKGFENETIKHVMNKLKLGDVDSYDWN